MIDREVFCVRALAEKFKCPNRKWQILMKVGQSDWKCCSIMLNMRLIFIEPDFRLFY